MTPITQDQLSMHGDMLIFEHDGIKYLVTRFRFSRRDIDAYRNFLVKHITLEDLLPYQFNGCQDDVTELMWRKGYVPSLVQAAYDALLVKDQNEPYNFFGLATIADAVKMLVEKYPGLRAS